MTHHGPRLLVYFLESSKQVIMCVLWLSMMSVVCFLASSKQIIVFFMAVYGLMGFVAVCGAMNNNRFAFLVSNLFLKYGLLKNIFA